MRVIDLPADRPANVAREKLTALGRLVLWALSVAGDDARFERELGDLGAELSEVVLGREATAALEALGGGFDGADLFLTFACKLKYPILRDRG
jgi:hypothetical protein